MHHGLRFGFFFAWRWHRGGCGRVRVGLGSPGASRRPRLVSSASVRVCPVLLGSGRVALGARGCVLARVARLGAPWLGGLSGVHSVRAPGACLVRKGGASGGRLRARRARRAWGAVVGAPFAVPGIVAVAGSRSLPPGGAGRVASVAAALLEAGHSLAVGCCTGADAAALSVGACSPGRVQCLAAFGPVAQGAPGSWAGSSVAAVAQFAAAGGAVSWWAGGPQSVPLRARLAARTAAVVARASAGCVVFFASAGSRGSLLAASRAAARGLPVLAFPLGFSGAALPSLGAGAWCAAGLAGEWAGAWRWVPSAQAPARM